MWRLILYVIPVFVNLIVGGAFFISSFRFSEAGCNKLIVTGTVAMWGLIYSIGSVFMGKVTTEKRAPKMVVLASLLFVAASVGSIAVPNIYLQYLWMALFGVAAAMYCTAFQIFAKDLESSRKGGIVRSASLYTVSWSLGMALGPSLFGIIRKWQMAFAATALIALLMMGGVLYIQWLRRHGRIDSAHHGEDPAPTGVSQPDESAGRPDLSFIGWFGAGLGTLTISVVRTLIPNQAVALGIDQMNGGLILAVVSYMQVAVGLLCLSSKNWMFKPQAFIFSGLCGVGGLALMAASTTVVGLYASTFVYGIFSGIFYFLTIYYSQLHPTRSAQYVATNESVVGMASIVGSICGGAIAQRHGVSVTFGGCAGLIALMAACQLVMFAFRMKAFRNAQKENG